jgi:hypothetical protein
MVTALIFSNDVWTFWDVMLFFFIWIPLVMLWFFCIFDVFARRDLSGWGKAAWALAIIVFPWLGALAYLIFRPWQRDVYEPSYMPDGGAAGAQSTPGGTPGGQVPVS